MFLNISPQEMVIWFDRIILLKKIVLISFLDEKCDPDKKFVNMNNRDIKPFEIVQLGCEILRKKAVIVDKVYEDTIQDLIDSLILTVKKVNGVGLAAPQVYVSKRIFIVASYPNIRYPNAPEMEPTAMINPKIISYSKDVEKDWEGCLSIPGIRALVPRYKSILVEYTDRNDNIQRKQFERFIARVFQHEYDHLNGLVFLDRIDSTRIL